MFACLCLALPHAHFLPAWVSSLSLALLFAPHVSLWVETGRNKDEKEKPVTVAACVLKRKKNISSCFSPPFPSPTTPCLHFCRQKKRRRLWATLRLSLSLIWKPGPDFISTWDGHSLMMMMMLLLLVTFPLHHFVWLLHCIFYLQAGSFSVSQAFGVCGRRRAFGRAELSLTNSGIQSAGGDSAGIDRLF